MIQADDMVIDPNVTRTKIRAITICRNSGITAQISMPSNTACDAQGNRV
jgi:hypothetical protein